MRDVEWVRGARGGHGIQHARGFWPMTVRQKLVPVANLGTQLGVFGGARRED